MILALVSLLLLVPGAAWAQVDVYGGATGLQCSPHASAKSITSIARTTNTVTVTVPSTTGYLVDRYVYVSGVSDATFNSDLTLDAQFRITAVTPTTITYAQTAANASSSGGTIWPARFDAQEINGRWWFCTPQRNVIALNGTFGFGLGDGATDFQGVVNDSLVRQKLSLIHI